jgi:proteic killer suppression protein
MVQSFDWKETESIFCGTRSRRLSGDMQETARRKLKMLDAAQDLSDLRIPPGNRLEALRGDRSGFYSIRINQQWHICFRWTPQGPAEMEIADYH